jgi:hypothetical protein
MTDQETSMLNKVVEMKAMSNNESFRMRSNVENNRDDTNRGIDVTHYSASMDMRNRLPTMSLEEFADNEYNEAVARSERESNAPVTAPKRYDQLVEAGEEDNESLTDDEAVYRDRNWDDWKDANPLGAGNKKWSQFM